MRSLRERLLLSHLGVSLLAVVLMALLTPPLFYQLYSHVEAKRGRAIVMGLAHAATPLLREGADSPHLQRLVHTSAQVLGAEVIILGPRGEIVISSNPAHLRGTPLPRALLPTPRMAEYRWPLAEGLIVIRKPVPGGELLRRAQGRAMALGGGCVALLAIALAYLSARAIAAPLQAMSAAARRLAAGDFTISLPERGPTEIRVLAASLNHSARSLASLEQLRREFVASASHELRAPLNAIRGFLEALLDGTATTEEQRQRCLQAAAAEAQRMTRLVEDLLQLSRLQAGVLPFDFAATNLRALAEGVVQSFAARVAEKDVHIQLESEPLPLVWADGERLVQVLVNLLDNALRYSPPGSVITIALRHIPGSPGEAARAPLSPISEQAAETVSAPSVSASRVVVSVQDEGPGIPEEDLARIFDRFHKADRARRIGDQGAGLGLAIAKEIVRRHGGDVFAQNRPHGGAEIGFWLPVSAAPPRPGQPA